MLVQIGHQGVHNFPLVLPCARLVLPLVLPLYSPCAPLMPPLVLPLCFVVPMLPLCFFVFFLCQTSNTILWLVGQLQEIPPRPAVARATQRRGRRM